MMDVGWFRLRLIWSTTPSLTLPRKGGEDKFLPPLWGKVRMGYKPGRLVTLKPGT
jgi:hypothetical protein